MDDGQLNMLLDVLHRIADALEGIETRLEAMEAAEWTADGIPVA